MKILKSQRALAKTLKHEFTKGRGSQAYFARHLGISPGYASNMVRKLKYVPLKRFEEVEDYLKLVKKGRRL